MGFFCGPFLVFYSLAVASTSFPCGDFFFGFIGFFFLCLVIIFELVMFDIFVAVDLHFCCLCLCECVFFFSVCLFSLCVCVSFYLFVCVGVGGVSLIVAGVCCSLCISPVCGCSVFDSCCCVCVSLYLRVCPCLCLCVCLCFFFFNFLVN